MSDPVAIDPGRLLEFVGGPGLAVVFVSIHPLHTFNGALRDHVRERGDEAVFGTVDLRDLVLAAAPALPFLHEGLRACGGPSALGVAPGYWLFREGEVLAWASGLPSAEDARAIARSALLGAVWSVATGRIGYVGTALRLAADDVAARRVAGLFHGAAAAPRVGGPGANGRAQTTPGPGADELARAYELLGVRPTATDAEVRQAWRRRQMDFHPDRAAQDPAESERRTRIAAELNRARDVILEARRRDGARASA